jgi:hypothetical protein
MAVKRFLLKFRRLRRGIYPKDLKRIEGLIIVEVEVKLFEERFRSSTRANSNISSGRVTIELP